MIQLIEVSENDRQQYNQFVANSPTGSFLQSWEWGEWQKNLGRGAFRFFLTDNRELITDNPEPLSAAGGSGTGRGNNIIGAAQFIKMPLPFGKYYLYAPYGPAGAENYELRIKNYELLTEALKAKFPDVVFIRIEPKNHLLSTTHYPLLTKTSNIQPGKTLLIDLSKNEDQLLAEMHAKTRYNIRLAQKRGVEIKDEFDLSIGHGLFAKEAVDLIVETASRQGYKGHDRNYYKKIIDYFGIQNRGDLKLHIYKAIHGRKLLSSAIMIDFSAKGGSLPTGQAGAFGGGTRTFLFGGSSQQDKNIMASYLLHWKAILDARRLSLSFYDFWGIETSSGKTPGFVRFKLGFAPQNSSGSASGILEYGGAYDIPINEKMYWLYRLAKKIRL